MRTLPAGKFKDICLKTMDEVAATGTPVVITKWGRPVARLVPASGAADAPPEAAADRVAEPRAAYGAAVAGTAPKGVMERLRQAAGERGVAPEVLRGVARTAGCRHRPAAARRRLRSHEVGDRSLPLGRRRARQIAPRENHDEEFARAVEEGG